MSHPACEGGQSGSISQPRGRVSKACTQIRRLLGDEAIFKECSSCKTRGSGCSGDYLLRELNKHQQGDQEDGTDEEPQRRQLRKREPHIEESPPSSPPASASGTALNTMTGHTLMKFASTTNLALSVVISVLAL
jgi:hypothetical protein